MKAVNVFDLDGLASRHWGTSSHHYYVFDWQVNVSQSLYSGTSIRRNYAYNAWGAVNYTTPDYYVDSDWDQVWQYNARWGYQRDTVAGLYYCQQRYYDPANGRWVTRDPVGYLGGINYYGYCAQMPVLLIDSLGLTSVYAGEGSLLDDSFFDKLFAPSYTPPHNPSEDDKLCGDRRPRPFRLNKTITNLECAYCLMHENVQVDSGGGSGDKQMHFIAGCLAKLRCGAVCPNTVGSGKELADQVQGGTVSQADALATDDGWDYAENYLSGIEGEFMLDDVKFCEYAARHSGW